MDGKQFPEHELKVEAAAAGKKPERSNKGSSEAASPDTTPIPAKGKADILFLDPNLAADGLRIAFDVKGRMASVSVSVIHKTAPPVSASATRKSGPPGRSRLLREQPRAPREPSYVPFRPREMIVKKGQLKAGSGQCSNLLFSNIKDDKAKQGCRCNSRRSTTRSMEMNALYQAVKKASDIRFRIYTEVGGEGETRQVDLFRIVPEGSRWPAAAGEAPSNLCLALANFRP